MSLDLHTFPLDLPGKSSIFPLGPPSPFPLEMALRRGHKNHGVIQMSDKDESSKHEFKAEVRQLLDILVHSLYTNREVFLRELISNASDANDKLRFEMNRGTKVVDPGVDPEIRITFDEDLKRLTITDTGVGMTREELVENIGTIAKSGSAAFLEAASEGEEKVDNIIGRFGVGFYSVFMVAKEVVIKSRSYREEEEPVIWRSDGLGTYEIDRLDGEVKRGTSIEVRLRDEAKEFVELFRIKEAVRKHSSFISFPIIVGDERVNTIPALWREPKFSIEDEQYNEFYKFLTRDFDEPLDRLHIAVDAPVQFNALLFVPKVGLDLFGYQKERPGLDLYIRRVLIQRGNKDLIPEYLGFVRGVVDSEDLPLNISRETLQENRMLRKITSSITKQILTMLEKKADTNPDGYAELWKTHGKIFKLGFSDFPNRERYSNLLRFNSSTCDDSEGLVSLKDYVERFEPEQKTIYYVSGTSREAIEGNPHLEIFRSKGLEVLYLLDPLDEFALENLRTFEDHELQPIEHVDPASLDGFESSAEEKKAEPLTDAEEGEFEKLVARVKEILGDKVSKVKISARLTESPCCLVSPDGAMTSSMERILKIASQDSSVPAKNMEINRDHPLWRNLLEIHRKDSADDYLEAAVNQLFESALLLEGYLQDPHAMVERMQNLLNQSSDWYLKVKASQ